MHEGDTLVAVDGLSLLTSEGAQRFASARAGQRLKISVRRDGKVVDLDIAPISLLPATTPTCLAKPGPKSSTHSSIENNTERGPKWEISWSSPGCSVDFKAAGRLTLKPDLSDVQSIDPRGTLSIRIKDGGTRRELAITPDRGGITHDWSVDGKDQTWNGDAQRWLGSFLTDLDRRTAFAIDVRFPQIVAGGGVAAVLDEIKLMPAEFPRVQYYARLVDSVSLDAEEVRRILTQLADDNVPDVGKARLLTMLSHDPVFAAGPLQLMYIKSIGSLRTDMARTRLLEAIATRFPLENEARKAYIDAANQLGTMMARNRALAALARKRN